MTIKQQIKHGANIKECHLHNGIFDPIQQCHTLSILFFHLPCNIHSLKMANYGIREWKRYM